VLLVDDDTNVLDLMETTVRADERLVLLRATDGHDAVRLCRDEHPDLVLMDVRQPLREGYGGCRLIKHNPRTACIKALMMTFFVFH
jgi:CheY-like chemotaxis protein